jgi:bacteriocin-like protein
METISMKEMKQINGGLSGGCALYIFQMGVVGTIAIASGGLLGLAAVGLVAAIAASADNPC